MVKRALSPLPSLGRRVESHGQGQGLLGHASAGDRLWIGHREKEMIGPGEKGMLVSGQEDNIKQESGTQKIREQKIGTQKSGTQKKVLCFTLSISV